ncbi:TfuA-like protein [Streptomyces sp. NPDC002067]
MDVSDTLAVFAGPSLAGSPFTGPLAPFLRPPVRAGDLRTTAAGLAPGAVLLVIDGEFGQSQAVTLTEIREALDAGFRVYGAASMGALRATECAPLGMTGLGSVAAAYAAGHLVGDDEVALLYDPDDYGPLTVPLVNVRRLAALLAGWGADAADRDRFLAAARELHFRRRTFAALRRAADATLPGPAADAARGLLEPPARRVWDVKLADAEAAVSTVLTGRIPAPRHDAAPVPAGYAALLDPEAVPGTERDGR